MMEEVKDKASGSGLSALYAEDLDDEDGIEVKVKKRKTHKREKKKTLAEERSDQILQADYPERLFDRISKTTDDQITDDVLNAEANWIMVNAFSTNFLETRSQF